MLPTMRLDDENFIDIFEKYQMLIPRLYPVWNDYNSHDPGITLLELMSWMKEMQQYYLDQIGPDNYRMYLKILGMSCKRKQPALSRIRLVNHGQDYGGYELPRGMKFEAGDLVFETVDKEYAEENRIVECVTISKGEMLQYHEGMINSSSRMDLYLFGESPKVNDCFEIYFEKPFETKIHHKLYFLLKEDDERKRNPCDGSFYPLSECRLEYLTEEGYINASIIKDETHCFLESGEIAFELSDEMAPVMRDKMVYGLRFVLEKAEYDMPPVMMQLKLNMFRVRQTDTKCDYTDIQIKDADEIVLKTYLAYAGHIQVWKQKETDQTVFEEIGDYEISSMCGRKSGLRLLFREPHSGVYRIRYDDGIVCRKKSFEVDGLPNQAYTFNDKELLYDGLEIMVWEAFDGFYHEWKKVDDFYASKPDDRHFTFDEDMGVLRFGDCEHGMAPEGKVHILRYVRCAGTRGNIKKHKIKGIHRDEWLYSHELLAGIEATNEEDISSGTDKEEMEHVFERIREGGRAGERAVTCEDYEEIVKKTPGLMIQKVKAWADEQGICMVVKPYSYLKKPKLGHAYQKNIIRNIEKKRMLGTRVKVLSPEYFGIELFVEASVFSHYGDSGKMMDQRIRSYFEESLSGFGERISHSEIFGMLDALECVSKMKSLSIQIRGGQVQIAKNEDMIVPPQGLVYLQDIRYVLTLDEE